MTDRFNSLTVVLAHDVREDDAEDLMKAIGMIKGIIAVKGRVVDEDDYTAQQRVRHELSKKLWDVLYSKDET